MFNYSFLVVCKTHRGLLKFVYILDLAAMAVRGSQEKFALEFLSVIIKSWGRGGGDPNQIFIK